jgi:hypothetical protein
MADDEDDEVMQEDEPLRLEVVTGLSRIYGTNSINPLMLRQAYHEEGWWIEDCRWEGKVLVMEFSPDTKDDSGEWPPHLRARFDFEEEVYEHDAVMILVDRRGEVVATQNCVGIWPHEMFESATQTSCEDGEECWVERSYPNDGTIIFCCERGHHIHTQEVNRYFKHMYILGVAVVCPEGWAM